MAFLTGTWATVDGNNRTEETWIAPRGGTMLGVNRTIAAGNFKFCGAMLAYADEHVGKLMKRGPGWNFVPEASGQRFMREINDLVLEKRIKPVIGKVVDFKEIPGAIAALANRKTTGRTIVRLW